MMLFDPMTHTESGYAVESRLHSTNMLIDTFSKSGPGDHGIEGIVAFRKQHECRAICKSMQLDKAEGGQYSDASDDDDN
jgi:hypothetical protein